MGFSGFILIGICFIISILFCFRAKQDWFLRFFPLYLLIMLLGEMYIWIQWRNYNSTAALYNILFNITIIFYLLFFWYYIRNKYVKMLVLLIMIVFLGYNLYFIVQGKTEFNLSSFLGMSVIFILCSIYYILEMFRVKESDNLLREPSFWIATALLFFYACSFTLIGLSNYLASLSKAFSASVKIFLEVNNYVYNILLCIAFMCKYLNKNFFGPLFKKSEIR